jgi:hypothetical protein
VGINEAGLGSRDECAANVFPLIVSDPLETVELRGDEDYLSTEPSGFGLSPE